MIGKKINQLATELAPVSTDLTIIGDPISGVSKKITLAQLGAIFSGAVSFYTDLASFPATGDINVIYCAKDTKKLYLWSGSSYVEVFPSQALLDTYQLRSEKGNANGYASLDSGGKVPVSQLPSSIMEYKGMWNAATNTPTLANGTGDTGDVYICNVAGTVDFGAGAITFAVGDYVIYSGSIWQRSSGAVGTVTSVAASITGDAIGITGSPVTTSGTLALAFSGTSSQYINGAGNLTTFPTLTGYVPYTGATANVDLGTFDLTADILTAATGSYTSSGGGNTLEISHSSGSGIALNITKGGNGEGLYINKTSGSGNAATIVGTLEATTLVKSGGTSTQFLKADGSVDSSTYLTTSAAATTYLPMVLSSTANSIEINGQFFDVASAANSYTSGRLIIAPTYGAIGYQNAGVFDGLKILTNGNAEFSNSGITRFFNQVRFDSTLSNGTYTYTLPAATGTLALTSDLTGGTVTSVGLSSATSGVTIGSTPITTSGTITLAIATASGSQQGLLSSTDWTTFNNKQSALTNPVTGTGTTNYLPKFTGTSTIGDSIAQDNGSRILINTGTTNQNTTINASKVGMSRTSDGAEVVYFSKNTDLGSDGTANIHGYNGIQFRTQGAESVKATLDASGNLGLGVTPSAWNSGYKVMDVSAWGSIAGEFGTQGTISLVSNCFANSTGYNNWTYVNTAPATRYKQYNGEHQWYNAPSGTAGNAISFTQAMTLNASGNLSVGNTNDTYKLDVSGTGRFTNTSGETLILSKPTGPSIQFNKTATTAQGWQLSGEETAFKLYNTTTSTVPFQLATTGAATFSSSVTATSGVLKNNSSTPTYLDFDGTNRPSGRNYELGTGYSGVGNDKFYIYDNTANVNRLVIDASGSVGIGTTSPNYTGYGSGITVLSLATSTSDKFSAIELVGNRGIGGNQNGSIAFINNNGTATVTSRITGINTSGSVLGGEITFETKPDAGSLTERMRITSGGNVLVNTASLGTYGKFSSYTNDGIAAGRFVSGPSTADGSIVLMVDKYSTTNTTSQWFLGFTINNQGTASGVITANGASQAAFGSWSDFRLKENITNLPSQLDKIMSLRPVEFDYIKSEGGGHQISFIAQEFEKVFPDAVGQRADGMKTLTGWGKTEAILVKAIQELKQELDTLKNK